MADAPPDAERPPWRAMAAGGRELAAASWRLSRAATVGTASLQPLSAVVLVLSALWLKQATDAVVAGDRPGALRAAVLIAASAAASQALAAAGIRLYLGLGERTSLAMEEQLARLVAAVPTLALHERPEQLDRIELLRHQRDRYAFALNALAQGLREVSRLVSAVALLVAVDARLAALAVVGAPSTWATVRARLGADAAEAELAERRRRARHLLDLATAPGPAREVRVFGLGPELARRWSGEQAGIDAAAVARGWQASMRSLAAWLPFGLGYLGAVALVLDSAAAGRATAGDVALVVSLGTSLGGNLSGVGTWAAQGALVLRSLARYALVRAEAEAAAPGPAGQPAPARLTEGLRLRGLSFAYPGTGALVLRDVDLLLPAGSTIALVGENGAGKTTLVKLLCRLYEPTHGCIEVDGQPLADIDIGAWRAAVSAGFQDFARFELLARESVGVGHLPAADDDGAVRAALDTAGGGELAGRLPAGLATRLGRPWGGVELSTGQWQQVAAGRAMMRRRPLLLVLDEPTASLDPEAEHRLFERYTARRGTTAGTVTVLVSHRFSTVRAADLIVVLERGQVVETGTHDQLMAAAGRYAAMFTRQARAYGG